MITDRPSHFNRPLRVVQILLKSGIFLLFDWIYITIVVCFAEREFCLDSSSGSKFSMLESVEM